MTKMDIPMTLKCLMKQFNQKKKIKINKKAIILFNYINNQSYYTVDNLKQ